MSVRRLHHVQPESFAFNAENLAWARQTIAKYPSGKQASAVIPLLWRAQEQNDNWVSKPVIEYVADMLGMSYIRVLEVATFYTMFQLQPVGRVAHIQVCGTTPCMLRGAEELKKVCQNRIHPEPHHLSADGNFSWEEVECLGACVNAPMVQIFKDTYEDLTPESFEKLIEDLAAGRKVRVGPQIDRHLAAPVGGPTTLIEPSLYEGQRSFTRIEAPPPPPPAAAPAPAAASPSGVTVPPGTPAPAPAAPKPEEVRPPTPAAVLTAAQKAEAERKEQAAGAVMEGKAQVETNVTRATPEGVKETAPVASVADGRPELHTAPKGRSGDDLKLIRGVGPRLEQMLNALGVWHFDQIAAWTEKEIAWVDERLEGFKGRVLRDEWVKQAKKLATGWRPEGDAEKPKK
ncbi:NADH-quinone oxidoreductase subunit NuoE [Aestuariivirga sp.]|uniref:NADH-quinone oxidoreductase subunit NuoE n=1 Tax=Aestuariivirga sp. TaxID=2650926 RepID=UPI00391A7E92